MIATWESTSVMSKSKPTTALTFQAYGECRVGTRWRNVVWMSTNARRRSLADDLRHRTDAELEDFLKDRPDLLHPLPADVAELARRAGAAGSIRRALGQLDRRTLNVAFAVAAQPGPVEIAAIRSAVVAAATARPAALPTTGGDVSSDMSFFWVIVAVGGLLAAGGLLLRRARA